MRASLKRSDGFTLIEVFIALALLGIGLLALAALQTKALEFGNRGRHSTLAAAIAESHMEELQRMRWTNLAPTGGWTAAVVETNDVQTGGTVTEQSFDVSWRIADLVAGRTRTIDVRVQWDEPDLPNRSYAISSIRFNYEGL